MLVARLDNAGRRAAAGPAVRAVAPAPDECRLLAGPAGASRGASCCPGVDECSLALPRGSERPARRSIPPTSPRSSSGCARLAFDQALIVSPPSTSRRCRWRCCCGWPASRRIARHQRSTTPARCSTSGTGVDDDLPEAERALSLARAAGFACPTADDGRLAVVAAAQLTGPVAVSRAGLCRGAPRRLGARAGLAGSSAAPRRSRCLPTPASGWWSPAVPDERAAHRGRRRRPRGDLGWAPPRWPSWPRCSTAPRRRRRQHRPGAPGRRRRHPGRLAVRAGRPGRAVGALRRPDRRCSATSRRPAAAPGRRECPVPGHPCLSVGRAAADVVQPRVRRRWSRHEGPALARARLVDDRVRRRAATSTSSRSRPTAAPTGCGRARTWDWPARRPRGDPRAAARRARRRRRAAAPARARAGPRVARPRARPRPARRLSWSTTRPIGRRAAHPAPAGRPATTSRSSTSPHFNALFWDNGRAPTTVIEHGIVDPGRALHRRAGPRRGRRQRAGPPRPAHRRRPAAAGSPRPRRSTSSAWALAGLHERYGLDPARVGLHDDLPQAAMHAELARRRVYVHPLRWTSLGLSLIEAMHLGMPVVALATTEAVEAVPPRPGVLSTRPDGWRDAVRAFVARPGRRRGWPARRPAPRRSSATAWTDSSRDWDVLLEGGDPMKIAMVSRARQPRWPRSAASTPAGRTCTSRRWPPAWPPRGHEVTVYTRRDDAGAARRGCARRTATTSHHVTAGPARAAAQGRPAAAHAGVRRACCAREWAGAPARRRARPLLDERAGRVDRPPPSRPAGRADVPRPRLGQAPPPGRARHLPEQRIEPRARPALPHRRPRRRHVHRRGLRAAPAGLHSDRTTVVPCGVDIERLHPTRTGRAAAARGRACWCLAGWSSARAWTTRPGAAAVPDAELVVVGGPPSAELDGDPEAGRLRPIAAELGWPTGWCSRGACRAPTYPLWIRSADVVLAVPWYEPFGITPLEAMACGRPVVATAVGGLVDTVVDGTHRAPRAAAGPGRARRGLVAAARVADAARRLRRRRVARARTRYRWDRVVARHRCRLPTLVLDADGPLARVAR